MKAQTEITIPTFVKTAIEKRICVGSTIEIINYNFEPPVKLPLTRQQRRQLERNKLKNKII